VLTFKQGEDEGIDEAWDRFNELLEQGPNLGFSGDLMLHTFYFSLLSNSSRLVSMCAGGDIMDKTISEAAQILQRISNGQRTQRDWQRRCREEQNDKSKPKVLAEISEKILQEFIAMFQGPLPAHIVAALTAIFDIDDDDANTLDDALLQHAGEAV
jgi:hypothetical protein